MSDALDREIRDLRSLYWNDERDPEGRAFAPLADAYRRAGDIDQAIELLDDGIGRHPDFVPGHMVAGWVHQARGDDVEAESAFRRVLELDDENPRALHDLGRLLAARGEEAGVEMVMKSHELDPTLRRSAGTSAPRPAAVSTPAESPAEESLAESALVETAPPVEAEEPVMSLDALAPEEMAEDEDDEPMMSLDALAPEVAEDEDEDEPMMSLDALVPEVEEEVEEEQADEPMMSLDALAPEVPEVEDDESVMSLDALAPGVEEEVEGEEDDDEPMMSLDALAPEVEGEEPEFEDEPEPAVEDDIFALDALAPDSPPPPAGAPTHVEAPSDFGDLGDAPPWEQPLPTDGAASADAEPEGESSDEDEGLTLEALRPDPTEEDEPIVGMDTLAPVDEESTADDAEAAAPEPETADDGEVTTRTMAEILARQGLTARAAAIYERLVDRNPDDARLTNRLEELRAELGEGAERDEAEEGPASGGDGGVELPDGREAAEVPDAHDEIAASMSATRPDPESTTPFAWIESDEDAKPADDGPRIAGYFSGLLGWPQGGTAEGSGTASGPGVTETAIADTEGESGDGEPEGSAETELDDSAAAGPDESAAAEPEGVGDAPRDGPDEDAFFDTWG